MSAAGLPERKALFKDDFDGHISSRLRHHRQPTARIRERQLPVLLLPKAAAPFAAPQP
jgi:hypothetical protein